MSNSFKTVPWADGSNIYEINVRQYSTEGTFAGFAKHLPRLRDMGVEILWFMPITPISREKRLGILGSYYACSSYTEINPEYGNMDEFKGLVAYAHKLGFKVIIDWVANHTGCDHHWTKEHPEWYIKDEQGNFTERNGWEDVIDLNFNSNAMRQALIDAMKFWINECEIDGFRCDMAHLVPLDFWNEARTQCETIKPLFWLAECEVMEYHQVFDVTYAWEWMHITQKIISQNLTLESKRNVLLRYSEYPKGADKLFFTSNHDENSWNGTEYEKYGNAAKALAVFACTWPGMPLIYSGQELPNYKKLKFFEKDTIEWKEPVVLHNFYQSLLLLNRNNSAMHNEARVTTLVTGVDDKILAYLLTNGASKVLVALNLSPYDKIYFNITHPELNGVYMNLFSGLQHKLSNNEKFELQAWEYAVYCITA